MGRAIARQRWGQKGVWAFWANGKFLGQLWHYIHADAIALAPNPRGMGGAGDEMMDRSIWDILAIEFEPGLAKAMIAAGIALETIFLWWLFN